MALDQAGDGRDELRQAGTQSHHGQADDGVRHPQGRGDLGAVVHQEPGAQSDGRRADDQQQNLLGQGLFLPAGFLLFLILRQLRVLLHLQGGHDHVDHEHAQVGDAHPAQEPAHGVGRQGVGDGGAEEEDRGQGEGLGVHLPGGQGNGDGGDEAGVADDGADGVAVADAGVALQGRLAGDHHLGQCRADGHDGGADKQLRQMKPAGDAHGAVHKPVAALDQQPKAHQEQQNGYQHFQ